MLGVQSSLIFFAMLSAALRPAGLASGTWTFLLAIRERILTGNSAAAATRGRVPEVGVVAGQTIAQCSNANQDKQTRGIR